MRTVNEVSKLTGVSIRTLHYYDKIGLLNPTTVTESGYRLYDDTTLEVLQYILLFRELEFPLKEIKSILNNPNFDKDKALEQQVKLLTLRKERLENLINLAREIKRIGVNKLDFKAFDTKKIDEYSEQAKEAWGHTDAYKEFKNKSSDWTDSDKENMTVEFMEIFADFGKMIGNSPDAEVVQSQVEKLQKYITQHFYTCTKDILASLGEMYVGDTSMKDNIDKAGGKGTGEFVAAAIRQYCE